MMFSDALDYRCYDTLDSTNEEAKRLLNAGSVKQTTLIHAKTQTAGRGTHGRHWLSPPNAGLYVSVVHPFLGPVSGADEGVDNAIPMTPLFTLAAGVACAETLQELTGLSLQLKPINDLYVNGEKLGGILTESLISQNHCRALITGIGINLFQDVDIQTHCASDGRGNRPTSLQACIAPHLFNQWHPDAIMKELSEAIALRLNQVYQVLADGRVEGVLARYAQFKLDGYEVPAGLFGV